MAVRVLQQANNREFYTLVICRGVASVRKGFHVKSNKAATGYLINNNS
jgi:hypothetical protein